MKKLTKKQLADLCKVLGLDNLDYAMDGDQDYFENDRGCISVGSIECALEAAFKMGQEAAKASK